MRELPQLLSDLRTLTRMPSVAVDLMLRETRDNDPFYARLVEDFYAETRKRHPRFPLIRQWRYGVALCVLPKTFDEYFMAIEAAGRRNCKKALRLGYRCERIRHNDHLAAMAAIHRSTDVRQGPMPAHLLAEAVQPHDDPPSRTDAHDYPYFGILKGDQLVAYSGNLVSGEAFMIEQLYGHARHHADGVVPLLIVEMARYALARYPRVKYYADEMYFGAGETMRRFKRKFGFLPCKVSWMLG